jgi:RNA polymerase sigma-70 factor (ECF subfamily)
MGHDDFFENDKLIISQIISGDANKYRILIRRYKNPVFAMGKSFFHNESDSEDFVQEVFLKAYRNLERFEGRSRFSTWLYRIAYHTAINNLQRRKEYSSLSEDESSDSNEGNLVSAHRTPEENLLRNTAKKAVLKAVKELPEKYRVCIDLYFFYDRTYAEIEKITGFKENTVKSHVFRAKKILKEQLASFKSML